VFEWSPVSDICIIIVASEYLDSNKVIEQRMLYQVAAGVVGFKALNILALDGVPERKRRHRRC